MSSQETPPTEQVVAAPWPIPYATTALALACIGVYVILGLKGVPWMDVSPEQQIEWGGNLAALTLTGDPWRLVSSIFLHGGLVHLLMNLCLLALVGPRAERRFGAGPMLVIYLAGGILASAVSAWWLAGHTVRFNFLGTPILNIVVSAGASGAILALCGALLSGFVLDSFDGQAADEDPGFGKVMLQVVGINLAMGIFDNSVDQAAHVGGLVAGAILGAVVGAKAGAGRAMLRVGRLLGTLALTSGALAAVLYASDWTEMHDLRAQLEDEQRAAAAELEMQSSASEADRLGLKSLDRGGDVPIPGLSVVEQVSGGTAQATPWHRQRNAQPQP